MSGTYAGKPGTVVTTLQTQAPFFSRASMYDVCARSNLSTHKISSGATLTTALAAYPALNNTASACLAQAVSAVAPVRDEPETMLEGLERREPNQPHPLGNRTHRSRPLKGFTVGACRSGRGTPQAAPR